MPAATTTEVGDHIEASRATLRPAFSIICISSMRSSSIAAIDFDHLLGRQPRNFAGADFGPPNVIRCRFRAELHPASVADADLERGMPT